MKFFFQIIFKIFLILTILAGCAIKETDPGVLSNRGAALLKEYQIDQSIRYFNKAIEINPTFAEAYINRGLAYWMKSYLKNGGAPRMSPIRGLIDKACSDWKRACELGECKGWHTAKNLLDCYE